MILITIISFDTMKNLLQIIFANKKIVLLSKILILLFAYNIVSAQDIIRYESKSIEINFKEINSLTARMQYYDYVVNETRWTASQLNEGRVVITPLAESSSEVAVILKSRLHEILQEDEAMDKTKATEIMLDLQEKHGTDLFDRMMGRDMVNDSCHNSLPFCTSDIYTFPAGVNSGTAQSGPNYGCLQTRPNPAWYHMKILNPGNIYIRMESSPLRDIDYIVWGPFTDPVNPCSGQLTSSKIVSCSYSTSSIETAYIPNGQRSEYYILLITNYSNQPCQITFSKTGGTGSTDCTILPPPIASNSPICFGEDLFLTAESYPNATYHWTGPNGYSSNQQNPILRSPGVEYSGTFSLEITVNGNTSDPVSLEVVINAASEAEFDYTQVCYGNPNIFTDQSTVVPSGTPITFWEWDFGDGNTSTMQNPQNTYASPGNYNVSLTTYTGNRSCPNTKVKRVDIPEYPYAFAGDDQEIPNGWSATLTGEANGGTGDLSYLWEPENLVTNPTELVTNTINLGQTAIFTLTVTDNISGCVSTDEVTVNVTGGALYVQAMAEPDILCNGESTQLDALPSGGAGNYTFSWTSIPEGFTSNIRNPMVSPEETTTYHVELFDGQVTVASSIEVTVKPFPVANAGSDLTINVGTPTQLNGSASGGTGNFSYLWSPADSLANPATDPLIPNPNTKLLHAPTTFHLVIHDANGCVSESDAMTVFTAGDFLAVYAQADHENICLYDSVELSATAVGGSGDYTYYWTADNSSWTSSEQNPVVNPEITTSYTVEVDDGYKIVNTSTTITVNNLPTVEIKPDEIPWFAADTINVCVRDSVWLDAGPNLNYYWSNGSTSRKLKAVTNGNWIDFQTWAVEVTNPVTGCKNDDTLTIFFDFNACNIGLDERNNLSASLKISPNPAGELVRVVAPEIKTDAKLLIFSDHGKILFEQALSADYVNGVAETIKLNNYKAGSYQIVLITNEAFAAKTLIIY